MYPTKIEVNNKIYELNTDYRTAIACFKVINDKSISKFNRGFAILTLLIGKFDLEDMQELLTKCGIYLRCGKEENDSKKDADMDYVQDERIIRTSIRQCYHENLNNIEYLHWWEYNEMIEGLTEDTILSKIREIRSYDLSEEKDSKRKDAILEIKRKVALETDDEEELSEEEERNIAAFDEAAGL